MPNFWWCLGLGYVCGVSVMFRWCLSPMFRWCLGHVLAVSRSCLGVVSVVLVVRRSCLVASRSYLGGVSLMFGRCLGHGLVLPRYIYFPSCQARLVRFYQSSSPPTASGRSQWAVADLNCKGQTAVPSAGPQWALLDLHCKCQIAVGAAGPQPPAPDRDFRV